jgi:AFG3 family protein
MDMLTQAFGGRVAEKLVFGHLSTGAKDDLQKITRIAYSAVSLFGMSPEIGPVSYPTPEEHQFSKPYSEETAQKIDEEVKRIVDTAYKRAEEILSEKSDLLKQVAEYLIKNETMSMEQFKQVAGPRPFPTDEQEKTVESSTSSDSTPAQEQPSEATQEKQAEQKTEEKGEEKNDQQQKSKEGEEKL